MGNVKIILQKNRPDWFVSLHSILSLFCSILRADVAVKMLTVWLLAFLSFGLEFGTFARIFFNLLPSSILVRPLDHAARSQRDSFAEHSGAEFVLILCRIMCVFWSIN